MISVPRTKAQTRRKSSLAVGSTAVSTTSTSATTLGGSRGDGLLNLAGKDFVLDVENKSKLRELTTDIEALGGRIATAVKDDPLPHCVVSDHPSAIKLQKMKPEQITPQMLRCMPMLLREAVRVNAKIRSVANFSDALANFKKRIAVRKKILQAPTKQYPTPTLNGALKPSGSGQKDRATMHTVLNPPCLKLEDGRGAFGPLTKSFDEKDTTWRMLHFGRHAGKSLFHLNPHPDAPRKEGREKKVIVPVPKSGFCEVCSRKYESAREHFTSREHVINISSPGLYAGVDALCGSFVDYIEVPGIEQRARRRPSPPSPHSVTDHAL